MAHRNKDLVLDSWSLVREGALTIAEEEEEETFILPLSLLR